MAYTIQQSINFAQTFIEYSPLNAGTGGEPAISLANTVQYTATNAPLVWPWNRDESEPFSLTAGVQDYEFDITDFSYLEKITLKTADGKRAYEIKDVYNTNALAVSITQAEPKSAAVNSVDYGTSVSIRFISVPDQDYTAVLTYQKLIKPITAVGDPWGIPDSYIDIYNNLFLAEAFQSVDDPRAQQYRMRGIAALLSKAEGLTELQRSTFLAQFISRGPSQEMTSTLKTQQGITSRGV